MATLLQPTRIPASGDQIIQELAGARTGQTSVSVARMTAPPGWEQSGQCPDFEEITFVLAGELHITDASGETIVALAGQAVRSAPGEWVRYSVGESGADYLAVCSPAFTSEAAHRDG